MIQVLILSAEPRLVEAVEQVIYSVSRDAQIRSVDRWAQGQTILLRDRFDLVCLDYECLKLEALDAFITIDNILLKEDTVGLLMVRQPSERSNQLENGLQSIRATLDMSQGKPAFAASVKHYTQLTATMVASRTGSEHSREIDDLVNVEFELPEVESGSVGAKLSLARLFYSIRVRKESGVLELTSGSRRTRIPFRKGEILLTPSSPTRGDILQLFKWPSAEFRFERNEKEHGDKVSTLELILDGVSQIGQRDLLSSLAKSMDGYAVPTNLWEERKESLVEFAGLQALMRICDGQKSLNDRINRLGSFAAEGFKAAYFAIETDLLHIHKTVGSTGALITYGRGVRRARQKVADSEKQKTKAFRAASEDRTELEAELTAQLVEMRNQTLYEVFEIWEGCGRNVVRERFYQLVKEHHPDVYGGNISGRVKSLAQEIFILVKETYQKLLRVEREQTAPPPPEWQEPESTLDEGSEVQFVHDEPKQPTRRRTPAPTHQRPEVVEEEAERPKVDVKSRLQKLSGFRRREQARRRRRTTPGHGLDFGSEGSDDSLVELSEMSEPSEPSQAEIEQAETDDRKAKLASLLKKAQVAGNGPSPAQEAFNEGYRQYKDGALDKAFENVTKAYELDPKNGLYLTFYGYLTFKMDAEKIDEAEDFLRKALQTGNRQAMPDACLFLAHLMKARGNVTQANKYYERALRLNPGCVEAERELRLAKIRDSRGSSEPGTFIKNLFKK